MQEEGNRSTGGREQRHRRRATEAQEEGNIGAGGREQRHRRRATEAQEVRNKKEGECEGEGGEWCCWMCVGLS